MSVEYQNNLHAICSYFMSKCKCHIAHFLILLDLELLCKNLQDEDYHNIIFIPGPY